MLFLFNIVKERMFDLLLVEFVVFVVRPKHVSQLFAITTRGCSIHTAVHKASFVPVVVVSIAVSIVIVAIGAILRVAHEFLQTRRVVPGMVLRHLLILLV